MSRDETWATRSGGYPGRALTLARRILADERLAKDVAAERAGHDIGTDVADVVADRMLTGMRRLHDGLSAAVPTLAVVPGTAPVATG
jgi:hypothetical protein